MTPESSITRGLTLSFCSPLGSAPSRWQMRERRSRSAAISARAEHELVQRRSLHGDRHSTAGVPDRWRRGPLARRQRDRHDGVPRRARRGRRLLVRRSERTSCGPPRRSPGGHAGGQKCTPPRLVGSAQSRIRSRETRTRGSYSACSSSPGKCQLCRPFRCRRRDSNPRHADYDFHAVWLSRAVWRGRWTQNWTHERT